MKRLFKGLDQVIGSLKYCYTALKYLVDKSMSCGTRICIGFGYRR
jgi:hypothetical protein